MSVRPLFVLLAALVLAGLAAVPAGAAGSDERVAESEFLRLLNDRRAGEGLSTLGSYWDLVDDARIHSRLQADGLCPDGARICHNPELGAVTIDWMRLGENVGVGYDVPGLDQAFWDSPPHRANVLGNYNYAGVGVVFRDDGMLYVTVVFMRGPEGLPPQRPGPGSSDSQRIPARYDFPAGADRVGQHDHETGRWSLDDSGPSFYYGVPDDTPVACDWDGDSVSSVGLYRSTSGYLYLRNENSHGVADVAIFYGAPADLPVCGDWDGDGRDTLGIFRPSDGTFYLRNANTLGFADVEFEFGQGGDIPLAGDWYGRGYDSVAVFRPATGMLYLADGRERVGNVLAIPRADVQATDELVVGDWDADGTDTVGFYRPSLAEFQLHLGHEPSSEKVVVPFGAPHFTPVAGAWG